jgi:hypothetical protein
VFVNKVVVANAGAAGNVRALIEAIILGVISNGPMAALIARGAVNGVFRRNPRISKLTRPHQTRPEWA